MKLLILEKTFSAEEDLKFHDRGNDTSNNFSEKAIVDVFGAHKSY